MDGFEELRALRSEVPAYDESAYGRAAAALDQRMRQPRVAGRGWLPRLAVPAGALAAFAIVAAAMGFGRKPQQASAATVLRDAAAKLEAAPATPLGAGQYWYVEQRGSTLAEGGDTGAQTYAAITTMVHTLWVARDGSGRIVRTDQDPAWVTPADHDRWVAAGSPPLTLGAIDELEAPGGLDYPFGTRTLNYDELRALPTDPTALASMIDAAAISSTDVARLDLIAELLRDAPLSPAQSAALYEVASALPGIELVGPTRDALGRAGVGIAVTSEGYRQVLILDARTGRLLGESKTNLEARPDLPANTVTESISFVRTGVVDSTTARP